MKPLEIRAELMRRGFTLTAIAREAKCTLPQISMCIGGSRIYPEIRRVIARHLERPVEKVFGRYHPQPKIGTAWCKAA